MIKPITPSRMQKTRGKHSQQNYRQGHHVNSKKNITYYLFDLHIFFLSGFQKLNVRPMANQILRKLQLPWTTIYCLVQNILPQAQILE